MRVAVRTVSASGNPNGMRTLALALFKLQIALGLLTLSSFADYPQYYQILSLAHLAWGTLVWWAALGNLLTLRYGKHGRFHG